MSLSQRSAQSLSGLAKVLGVESSAAAEAARWLEADEESRSLVDAARALGCRSRTLQRALRADGVSMESLRSASRLVKASGLLRSEATLTGIAAEAGFCDSAHMTRAFRASCGMTPSLLRRAAKGGAEPEPVGPVAASAAAA